jgi:hypothetical protein
MDTLIKDGEAHARNTDPETSRLAAEAVNRSGSYDSIKAAVLAEIHRQPGQTSAEIGAAIAPAFGLTPKEMRVPAARATSLLRNERLVYNPPGEGGKEFKRKCHVVGSLCIVWRPVIAEKKEDRLPAPPPGTCYQTANLGNPKLF